MVWILLVILVQAFIFTLALFGIVYGLIGDEYVPVLLLAFTMILANEHMLTTTSKVTAVSSPIAEISLFESLMLSR